MPTRAFPNPFQGSYRPDRGPEHRLASWQVAETPLRVGLGFVDLWCQQRGFARPDPREAAAVLRRAPHLFCWSRHVLPRPEEWPEHARPAGYALLSAGLLAEPHRRHPTMPPKTKPQRKTRTTCASAIRSTGLGLVR